MASIKTKDLDKTSPKYAYTALWPVNNFKGATEGKFLARGRKYFSPEERQKHTLPNHGYLQTHQQGNFSPVTQLSKGAKMAAFEKLECLDFLHFQDIIKKMRELDDKIIYTLNVHLPTESFKAQIDPSKTCKDLFGQLSTNFEKREQAIQNCINFTKKNIADLKQQKETKNDDINVLKALRKEQSRLKLLQTELGVEEVVRDKTSKIIYERCRIHYVPPNFNV